MHHSVWPAPSTLDAAPGRSVDRTQPPPPVPPLTFSLQEHGAYHGTRTPLVADATSRREDALGHCLDIILCFGRSSRASSNVPNGAISRLP